MCKKSWLSSLILSFRYSLFIPEIPAGFTS
jgi:hypothetical protein